MCRVSISALWDLSPALANHGRPHTARCLQASIRDHPEETYGLYGQFYDDFDFQFGAPYNSAGMPSYESCIKIEARFLTYNFGLDRIGIRIFAMEGERTFPLKSFHFSIIPRVSRSPLVRPGV